MGGERLLDELGRFDGDAEILQSWRDGMAPEPTLLDASKNLWLRRGLI